MQSQGRNLLKESNNVERPSTFSFTRELNSSVSSEYDSYVEGCSGVGSQNLFIGLRPGPSSKVNVSEIDSRVITSLKEVTKKSI